jgi:hypothetical protein
MALSSSVTTIGTIVEAINRTVSSLDIQRLSREADDLRVTLESLVSMESELEVRVALVNESAVATIRSVTASALTNVTTISMQVIKFSDDALANISSTISAFYEVADNVTHRIVAIDTEMRIFNSSPKSIRWYRTCRLSIHLSCH